MPPANERAFYQAKVYIDGTPKSDLHCVMIEDAAGDKMSRAILVQTFGQDKQGPVTLLPKETGVYDYQFGQRVTITTTVGVEETTLFEGWLMRRSDQGAADKVIWQALDDKILLNWIPVRGCLVYDGLTQKLRYSARHPTHFNPGGFFNCTGWQLDGVTYPVFTNVANRSKAYEAPNTAYKSDTLVVGKYTPWTPRRALAYLHLWCNIGQLPVDDADFPKGFGENIQTALAVAGDSAPLVFSLAAVTNMHGYDPADTDPNPENRDPLDYKLNDLNIQGRTALAGLNAILDQAGTHTLYISYDSSTKGSTEVGFKLTGYAPASGNILHVQRGGDIGQEGLICDTFDFNIDEDASLCTENVLVEGDVVRGETRMTFAPDFTAEGYDYASDTTSDLVPAWTREEEAAFMECIHGGPVGSSDESYAKRARIHGDPSSLELCDGGGTPARPIIWARLPEAFEAASESFPTVFRAWKVNGRTSRMQEFLGKQEQTNPNDVSTNPGGLAGARPILPQQLQFFVKNLGGGTNFENWLTVNIPVRIEIKTEAGDWITVPKDTSVRVTADGLLWLDGLSVVAAQGEHCVLTGNIFDQSGYDTGGFLLRHIRVNAAVPTDFRVRGKAFGAYEYMSNTIRNAFYGTLPKLQTYVDSGQSYKHHYQWNSYPAACGQYYGGTNGTTTYPTVSGEALTRDVPPGSEAIHAEYAAKRILARRRHPRRESSFRTIGLKIGWRAGDRLYYVSLERPGNIKTYYIRAPIMTVTHDFLSQESHLGGITSDFFGANG